MPTFVRVKLANGHEATVTASFAEAKGLTVLDKPATSQGRLAPPKTIPAALKPRQRKKADPQESVDLASEVDGDAEPTTIGGESATSQEDSE